jgi:hypothetical protein
MISETKKIDSCKWKTVLPRARKYILDAGLDNDPKHFDIMLAKIITREVKGNKGVLLYGVVGSGKSRRFELVSNLLDITIRSAKDFGYAWKECEGDSPDFQEYCLAGRIPYNVYPPTYHDLIIDDLGIEAETYNAYGNTGDVLQTVIEFRYKVFPQFKTYFTTNLNDEELKNRYGERCYSRLNEMCAFVKMEGTDRRIMKNN